MGKHRNKKKKRQDYLKKIYTKYILIAISVFAAFIGLIVFFKLPSLQPFRDSIFFDILIRLAPSGIVVYFAWFYRENLPLTVRIVSSLYVSLLWLPWVIESSQVLLLIDIIVFFIWLIYIGALLLIKKEKYLILNWETIFLGISVCISFKDYTFIDNSFPFWELPLIIAFIALIATIVLLVSEFFVPKDNRKSERIAWPILVAFFAFFLTWSIICNLNYALDFTEPQIYTATVVEKEIITHSRGRTSDYVFHLLVGERKIKMYVSQTEYYHYDENNNFPVKLYDGAFGEPFFISGNR